MAEVAGLTSFSFGEENVDRYIMIWKKVTISLLYLLVNFVSVLSCAWKAGLQKSIFWGIH